MQAQIPISLLLPMNRSKIIAILFFFTSNLFYVGWSQNTKQCDSLIANGIDLMWKKKHEKSLEVLIKAKAIAEKNKWYEQYFNASNNIGGNYYLMLDYGEALNQYLESYTVAITHLDDGYEMIILNNIAILYSKEKRLDKAYEYFLKAYDIAKKKKDLLKVGYYAVNLGSVLNEMNNPSQALKYIRESFILLKKQPDILYLAAIVQAENDLLLGKPEQSRNKAMALLSQPKNKFSDQNQAILAIIIAKSFSNENNLKPALDWALKALAKNPDSEKRMEIFKLMSDIHSKLKNYETALQYKDSVHYEQNKLNEIKNGRLFENSQIKFQLQNYKKEIAEKDSKIKNDRFYLFSIAGIITLLLVFVAIMYRNRAIRNKQSELIAQRNEEITLLKLQKETDDNALLKKKEEIALLEQDRLQKEVQLQNQKIASKALYLSGKDQLLLEILKSLGTIPELHKSKTLANHIRELKKHLSTANEWDNFMIHFEETNQGLLQKLKVYHPALSQNDLRYISYEYMNLSTKEIATLLNITPDACRKRKERIVSKLGLKDHLQLNDYLSNI